GAKGGKFLVGLQFREPALEAALAAMEIPYTSFDGAEHELGDGDHWTPKGHELVAERLLTLLKETGVAGAAQWGRDGRVGDLGRGCDWRDDWCGARSRRQESAAGRRR